MVEDGGDVFGVSEIASGNKPGQEFVDVVVTCFGTTEFRGERPERFGGDDRLSLLGSEARGVNEGDPSVVLGGGGDGFVFGGELADVRPDLLLDLDGLVGGGFCADVLEHPEQDAAGSCVEIVTRMRSGVVVVGSVGRDVPRKLWRSYYPIAHDGEPLVHGRTTERA